MFLRRWGIGEIVHGLLATALIGLQVGCSKSSQIDTGASISVTNSGHAKVADAVTGAILGNFSLLNESAPAGNSMTILSGVSSEGDNLVTYWSSNTPGFEIVTMGNGQYEVVELLGGRCLTLNGSAVTITTCSGASNQLFSLNLQSDGSYTIASGGGKCVEALGAFATVAAAPCAASSSQYWMITGPVALNPGAPTPTPAPSPIPAPTPVPSPVPTPVGTGTNLGNFSLLNESATAGNSMTILSGVSSEGDNLVTYWASATPGFEIVTMGNNQYKVVELLGGRCLTLNGSAVTITTCSGASNQLFSLNLQSDGSYTIASGGGKCVEALGAFATVAAAPCAASSSQYWMITGPVALNPGAPTPTPAPSPAPTPTPSPTPSPAPANSGPNAGIYQIQSIAYSLELTVGNGQASAGDQLVTYFANSALGEEFKVVPMGNGQFEVQEQTLGYCLTVNGNSLTTQTCDGDAGQLFALTLNKGDGAYTIVDMNGLCVNESVAYGTISEATCNGSSSQLWYFTLISPNPSPGPTPAPSPTPSPTPASGAMPGRPSALPALAQKFRLMTLGDSMTGGYGGADQEGYRGPLYNMLVAEGYSPQMTGQINCGATTSTQYPLPSSQQSCDGIGGEQIAALDSSMVSGQWVANENPDVVLLWIGFNSVYYTANTTAQDLSQLNQMINDILVQKPNVRLIVAQLIASTQCCGTGLIAQYNAGIPSLVSAWASQGYHVSMANLYGTSGNPVVPPTDLYDYVHPNDAGYDLVANVWLQSINAVAGAMTGGLSWQTLKVGAGGYVRGLDVAPDGTTVGRTDTYGAYLWSGTQWQQLVNSNSMPSSVLAPGNGNGVYEIRIAPSNTQILYMSYNGYVFVSTNRGATWTQTGFTPVSSSNMDPNDSYGQMGQKAAIDPINSNVVYIGTEKNTGTTGGLFVTANGGANWQSVSTVPSSTTSGITGIVFDPSSGTTAGKTNIIYASSNGNGVYRTVNAGASWTLLTGGPTTVQYATISNGIYYATDGSSLWSYKNGAWTNLWNNGADGIQAVAVSPSNPNLIAVVNAGGYVNVSYNAGASWVGKMTVVPLSTDISWLTKGNITPGGWAYLDAGGLAFNPLNPTSLIMSAGTGVWATTISSGLTSSSTLTWKDQSTGIEQLVANDILVPPGGKPILASWDRPFFYISDPSTYPSTYFPVNSANIVAGWSIDYASSTPSFLVGIADWWSSEQSGYSSNGGQTWNTFASFPPGAGSSYMGGTIAASTPSNIIWAPAGNQQPYYTTNGGASWTGITLPGVSSWSGFDYAYYLNTRTVTADRVLPNTFYLFFATQGLFTSTNGGVTWTKTFAGDITLFDGYNAKLRSVPGEARNLFFTGGAQGTLSGVAAPEAFMRSTDGGATWTPVPNVQEVLCFGFGAPQTAGGYPAIYIVGWVNNVYGVWQSSDNAQTWKPLGPFPNGNLDTINTISGDPNTYGVVYVGFGGAGYAYYGP